MVLTVFGISHKTSTLEEREPFQLSRRQLGEAVLLYKRVNRVDEVAVIASCNRVEFYRAHRTKGRQGLEVVNFYRELGVKQPERILEISYRHVGAGAARHLFRVTSGMDSLVIGEDQIFSQVKDAYSAGCAFGGPGKVLHKLFHYAFRCSKKVRNETEIAGGARSIPGAAVDLLLEQNPNPGKVLVIGADETTEIILNALSRHSIPAIITNRNPYNAQKLAEAYGTETVAWDKFGQILSQVDMVFSATGADDFVVFADAVPERSDSRLLIADLAIPRDIHPEVGRKVGVELYDLQDLKYHLERLEERRCANLPNAQEIIEENVDAFLEWLHAQSFAGGVNAVKSELHQAAAEEMERFAGSFHQSERKALEAFSHAMIKRFLKIARRQFEPRGITEGMAMLKIDPALIEEILPLEDPAARLKEQHEETTGDQ